MNLYKLFKLVCLLLSSLSLVSCSSLPLSSFLSDTGRTEQIVMANDNAEHSFFYVRPDQRINVIGKTSASKYCPEFTPIAGKELSLQSKLETNIVDKVALKADQSGTDSIKSLQTRAAGIQFYEQGLFALCIAALNGWVGTLDNESPEERESRIACIKKARQAFIETENEFDNDYLICLTQYETMLYGLWHDTQKILLSNEDTVDIEINKNNQIEFGN